jgi:hypothetical protein
MLCPGACRTALSLVCPSMTDRSPDGAQPLCLFLVTSASWRLRGVKRPPNKETTERRQRTPGPLKGNEAKPSVTSPKREPRPACGKGGVSGTRLSSAAGGQGRRSFFSQSSTFNRTFTLLNDGIPTGSGSFSAFCAHSAFSLGAHSEANPTDDHPRVARWPAAAAAPARSRRRAALGDRIAAPLGERREAFRLGQPSRASDS